MSSDGRLRCGYGAKGPTLHGEYRAFRLPEFHYLDRRKLVLWDWVKQHKVCAPRLGIVVRGRASAVVQNTSEAVPSSEVRDELWHAVLRPRPSSSSRSAWSSHRPLIRSSTMLIAVSQASRPLKASFQSFSLYLGESFNRPSRFRFFDHSTIQTCNLELSSLLTTMFCIRNRQASKKT